MRNRRSILHLIRRLKPPFSSPHISPLERQLLSRLLNSIVIIMAGLLVIMLVMSVTEDDYTMSPAEMITYGAAFALGIIVYWTNRRGYVQTAGLLLATSCTVLNITVMSSSHDSSAVYLTYYFIVPVMISNLFASFQVAAYFYAAHLLLMFAVPVISPAVHWQDLPVIFYVLAGGIVLFTRLYRNLIDTRRRLTEQRYQSLFESIYDPVIVYEGDLYREINPAFEKMFDLNRADVINRSIQNDICPVTDPPDALINLSDGTWELLACRRDRVTFSAEVHVRSYQQDRHLLHVATIRDLTERKLASQQSEALALERERVRLMRRFINDVSHDLRTPLTTLMTGLHMIKISSTPEQRRDRIDTMERHIQIISQMLDNMLTIARLDKAAENLFDFQEEDLNQIALECFQEQRLMAENKMLHMHFSPDAALPPVLMDQRELRRALRQLFLNAMKYTPEGGSIEVRTRLIPAYATFEIQDSGIGIPPEKLSDIFTLFYRVDEARGMDTGGMGMGLAICQRIVNAHHGKIEV